MLCTSFIGCLHVSKSVSANREGHARPWCKWLEEELVVVGNVHANLIAIFELCSEAELGLACDYRSGVGRLDVVEAPFDAKLPNDMD